MYCHVIWSKLTLQTSVKTPRSETAPAAQLLTIHELHLYTMLNYKDLFSRVRAHGSAKAPDNTSRMLRGGSLASDWMEDTSCRGTTHNFKVGIYGWRKRCLYLLILGLLVMVIVNLALTLWVLKVMEFSSEGMGQLRIVTGGIQLSGQAMVLDALLASTIRSRRGQPITLESSRNFTINTRDEDGRIVNRIFLGNDRLECHTRGFRVTDTRGTVLFSADKNEVVVGAEVLRVTGDGGAIFDGTVQTPLVRADSGNELRLESPTRSLEVRAPLGVLMESRAGDISASCLTDLKLQSVAGAVRLDSANVYLSGLKTATPTPQPPPSRGLHPTRHEIYQLCVCSNGKLFLAPPEGLCAADNDSSVCR
ncbi:delta-sarcoglycan isoform X2 [Cryptotermes secundus]|uniref:delta-sarcoglycan isoform X2 n=1 Tax=Cryptotermes secundus TaxID=105785 RepID=UPI001454DA39|nr:delta-sarcoglycan isoform X2 [Cryptotermes secundus]